MSQTLRIAIPNKGRLMEDTAGALRAIGLRVPHSLDRALVVNAQAGRTQLLLTRAQDIPEFVELGAADAGITGLDLVEESGATVDRLLDLGYGQCRLVVAAPEGSKAASLDDLPANARVATTYPNLTRRFFEKRRQKIQIVPISGAAEITPLMGVADAIADLTQTGATLKQNHLVELDVILESRALLIASPKAHAQKRAELDDLAEALASVEKAARKRYLMANVDKKNLDKVTQVIPGLAGPTVMQLATSGMVAVHAVVDEDHLNTIIPRLRKAGATGILVLPIERIIP